MKGLEQMTDMSTLELDKYKLLVSESDVINNLMIKLCSKLATIENSIDIIELKNLDHYSAESIKEIVGTNQIFSILESYLINIQNIFRKY